MLKNHELAKLIAVASWSEFQRRLKYKAEWYWRILRIADTFAPVSRMCHVCGALHREVRVFRYGSGYADLSNFHDRDVKATRNVENLAI